jgi:hypothetical protein
VFQLSPLDWSRTFTAVAETLLDVPAKKISDPWVDALDYGLTRHYIIDGIDDAVVQAVEKLCLFSELDLPWASTPWSWQS